MGEKKLCRPVKICPGPGPVGGLVVGKRWARGSLTFHEVNVPAFLVSKLRAKSFSPKCQGAGGESMPRSVGEFRLHASSGAPDSGITVLAPGALPLMGLAGASAEKT